MIGYAIDSAEKQLRNGTASSQIITHYLKLASPNAKIERRILEKQEALLTAKIEAVKSAQQSEVIYREALEAMRSYSGQGNNSYD